LHLLGTEGQFCAQGTLKEPVMAIPAGRPWSGLTMPLLAQTGMPLLPALPVPSSVAAAAAAEEDCISLSWS
jgi:hypothetical protein